MKRVHGVPSSVRGGRIGKRPKCSDGVNSAESAFIEKVLSRGNNARVLRSGWPDFLITESWGTTYAVEVKRVPDVVSQSQVDMFSALEELGMKVYIWDPANPDRLGDWKKWPRQGQSQQPRKKSRRQKNVQSVVVKKALRLYAQGARARLPGGT